MAGREPGGNRPERTVRESKTDLLEAAQAAVANQRTKGRTPRSVWGERSRARAAYRSTMTGLILAGTTLLLLRPVWLAGPRLPPEPAEIQTASATLALIEAASHVRAYHSATGRLPERLKDAGVTDATIRYRKIDTLNFVIRLAAGDSTLTLRSTDSLRPLVNEAVRALRRRN